MLSRTLIGSLLMLTGSMALLPAAGAAADSSAADVKPIEWKRFRRPAPNDPDYAACRRILLNAARQNLAWISQTYTLDSAKRQYIVTQSNEQGTRRPASAAFGLAVLLKTGAYDEKATGVPRAEATARATALIKGVAANYTGDGAAKKGWHDQWQSAFWATLVGQAGWMLWDDLDGDARNLVAHLVEHEADRFVAPGYKVPYWANIDGKINFSGDTKAEENAWNASLLQVALAMLPRHPHAEAWKTVADELMVSAFALQKDALQNTTIIDSKPVKEWLHGYNVRDDGAVINHNRLHPDYMATPTLNLRTYLVQPLAGQKPFAAARWNADFIYRTYVTQAWPSPPNKAPGGTIYRPGEAYVYYPTGTDWSPYRLDIFYLYDVFADVLKLDKDLPIGKRGKDWERLRAAKMEAMQARHPDGSMFAPGEYESYPGREQMVAWQLGDALLLRWLKAQGAF